MSQTEQEFIRNFCPTCQIKVTKDAISCNNCGGGDLIPDPYSNEQKLIEEIISNDVKFLQGIGYEVITPENDPLCNDWDKLTNETTEHVQGLVDEVIEETDAYIFPTKMEPLDKMYEGEALGDEEEFGIGVSPRNPAIAYDYFENNKPIPIEEKSPLQLDENAVYKLTHEKFGFLTGNAGTGKSTLISELSRLNFDLLEICATTGIAAINLNSKTLHSTLKFFDTKSLQIAHMEQLLHMNLRKVRARRKILFIDEVSMLGAEKMDLICNAIDDINQDDTGKTLGLWVGGDMCQLPPVKEPYVFKSDYWDRFENNKVRLTKVWRQDNVEFMKGIDLLRSNKGVEAMEIFKKCGVNFSDKVNDNFEGTTLIPNNNDVDMYNEKRLRLIEGKLIRSQSKIRGKEMREWEKLVPAELRLKVGAYVMVLSNDVPEFKFVNGDCGWVESYDESEDAFNVKLKRTNNVVSIKRIKRQNFSDKEPEAYMFTPKFQPYQDFKTGDWVIGEVLYHPLRLAYASTIHKSQGLSLDMVQINTRPQFFSYDAMGYVSISRARTPEGLFLVGTPEGIGRKITMNKEVLKYV